MHKCEEWVYVVKNDNSPSLLSIGILKKISSNFILAVFY